MKIKNELHHEISNIKPIAGMVNALCEIKNVGLKLGVMSSNSTDNIKLFLSENKLDNIFDFIYSGKNIFGKDKVISHLLRKQKINKKSVIYVGDETRDIDALKRIKIPIIAVSWGFNSHEVLEKQNPDALIDSPEQLLQCILNLGN